MAQAAYNAGVITENTTAALEEAMKKGKVMADDVLPSFAKVLNDATENADFDSLQTSINRMKNSFAELVEGANFEGLYKGLVDNATKTLNWLKVGFWPKVAAGFAGVFGGTAIAKGMRNLSSTLRSEAGSMAKQLEVLKVSHNKFRSDIVNNYDTILKKMNATGRHGAKGQPYFGLESYDKSSAMKGISIAKIDKDYLKAASAAREYNQQLLDMDNFQGSCMVEGLYQRKMRKK